MKYALAMYLTVFAVAQAAVNEAAVSQERSKVRQENKSDGEPAAENQSSEDAKSKASEAKSNDVFLRHEAKVGRPPY